METAIQLDVSDLPVGCVRTRSEGAKFGQKNVGCFWGPPGPDCFGKKGGASFFGAPDLIFDLLFPRFFWVDPKQSELKTFFGGGRKPKSPVFFFLHFWVIFLQNRFWIFLPPNFFPRPNFYLCYFYTFFLSKQKTQPQLLQKIATP
jgi:hypothetical protein